MAELEPDESMEKQTHKVSLVFTHNEKLLNNGVGYWVHHSKKGRIRIYIKSSFGPKKKIAILVHELTEALATQLTKNRIFNERHHANADLIEKRVDKLLAKLVE